MTAGDVATRARAWLDAEPDDDIRDELHALIDGPEDALADGFAGRLTFGTAGLRAAVGAGPLRMNRLVVAAETHQCFGTWMGWMADDAGTRVRVDGVPGWAEEARNRW